MKIQVWDTVVRGFHWGTVILLPLCWWTAEQGEMSWHQTFAYLLAVLLTTRLLWGLFGSETARFTSFVRSPKAVMHYLANWHQHDKAPTGHNPAGGYMVMVMLCLLLAQFSTGLFATDDILTEGPLYASVSDDTASLMTSIHHLNFDLLAICIGLHLLAILVYRLKGVNLVKPMITGKQPEYDKVPQMAAQWPAALLMLGLLGVVGYGLIWPLW